MSVSLHEQMKKGLKLDVKQQIFGIIAITVTLVGTIGIFTYLQFSEVLDTISDTSKEDPSISKTKEVLSTISRAENRIRSYTLTEDSMYLNKYADMKSEMDVLLRDLKTMKPEIAGISIDTFQSLVQERFVILEELVGIQNEFRVEDAFKSVADRVKQGRPAESTSEEKTDKRWFNFRKKPAVKSTTNIDLSEIQENIQKVSAAETRKEEIQVRRELELLNAERKNDMRVQAILAAIEVDERKTKKEKSREMKALINRTNFQIILFCAAVCGLLIFMTTTIVNYIRRNNEYRRILKKAKKDAESLAKAKELFVATLSHEIRTPINIISGFTEQLSQTTLTEEQREQLRIISQSSSHLLDLINAVLDFTKLENNKLVIESTGFSPEKEIASVKSLLSSQATAGGVQLLFETEVTVPDVVIGDAFRLRQILINLVGNAIKFSYQGNVHIRVSAREVDAQKCIIELVITDDGIGMTEEQLALVFNEFEQAEKSTARLYGGTGLGLPITKKLIELQGGTIRIESIKDKGTTVFAEIPFEIGEEADLADASTAFPHVDLSKFTILVVDDEQFNRKLVHTILSKYGVRVLEATDGQEAIQLTQAHQPDLILMDEQMPNLNGIESAKRIRELHITSPIIGLSAAVTPEYMEAIKNSFIDDYLPKPFRQAELMEKIVSFLSPDQAFTTRSNEQQLGFEDLKSLSDGDTAFYLEMLETFENSTSNGLAQIKEAILQKNWSIAAEYAHRISAPCKHLSADKLYGYLKEIETNCREEIQLDTLHDLMDSTCEEADRVLSKIRAERLSFSE